MPYFAFAEDGTSTTAAGTAPVASMEIKSKNNFCTNIATTITKISDQVKNAEEKTAKNQEDRSGKMTQRQGDADIKRATDRSNIDAKRVNNWDNMTTRAKTDVQKAAVTAYTAAIKSAVDARRTSVDAAVTAYRAGLTQAMTDHSGAITTAIAAFKSAVDTAVAKAQADCAANVAPKTVKENFYQSVTTARKALQAARKSAEMTSGLSDLKKTRDTAIKAAETTFKTATEKARADLKMALKK